MHFSPSKFNSVIICSDKYINCFVAFERIITTGIPILLATLFGPDLVSGLIDKSPEWLLGGLQVAGGILPAVGIALLLRNLPTKDYFAYLSHLT